MRQDIEVLKRLLLQHGGWKIDDTPPTVEDELTPPQVVSLLRRGEFYTGGGNVVVVKGREKDCHANTEWLCRHASALTPCHGLALGGADVWVVHSWAMTSDGRVVETTTPRRLYFGVCGRTGALRRDSNVMYMGGFLQPENHVWTSEF